MNLRMLIEDARKHLAVTKKMRNMTNPRWRGTHSGIPEHLWTITTHKAYDEYEFADESIKRLEEYADVYYEMYPDEEML